MATGAEPLVRKVVTVVFCDVSGSTSLGEQVDPETMRRVMIRYFAEMRSALERHGGSVEKFIGDAVMAVFGVPTAHEDDALRAVRAAHEMRSRLGELNAELESRWGMQLEARIGIDTGEVVVGDPSTRQTVATGDAVNVAARLQQAAQPGEILLGRETYRLVAGHVAAEPLESVSLKGKRDPVASWRLEDIRRADEILRRLDAPIVGRTRELLVLHDAYTRAVEHETCELVTVVGEPGIGKTRLVQELAAQLLDATIVYGNCISYGDGITFWPITQILRALAHVAVDAPAELARRRLEELVDDSPEADLVATRLAPLLGLSQEPVRSEETFWALRRLFEGLARARPLVVVLEDMHWAEPTLLDLVEYLAGWSIGAPIVIVCTARPELADARPEWLAAGAGRHPVALDGLAPRDVDALIGSVLGTDGVDDRARRLIADPCGGNPLFVEELVRALVEDGRLRQEDGRWLGEGVDRVEAPPTIGLLLAARLDRLDPDERTVLQCASVVGREFWWTGVAELAPTEATPHVGRTLQSLVRKHLIQPSRLGGLAGEDAFRFSHALVRDAAYASLAKEHRAELHERHADWLSKRVGGGVVEHDEIVGFHLEQAWESRTGLGPVDAATREVGARGSAHLAAAGRRAVARGDMRAAARLLRRAVRLDPDDATRAFLSVELGLALMESGDLAAADAVLSETVEDASRLGYRDVCSHAALGRAYVGFRTDPTGALDSTRAAAEDAIAAFSDHGDDRGLARAFRLLSLTHSWHCRWDDMGDALRRALVHAVRAGDERERTTIVIWLQVSLYYGPTTVDAAIEHCRNVLETETSHRVVRAMTACRLAGLLAMRGSFDEARELGRRGTVALDDLGLRVHAGHARAFVADSEFLAGDPAAAERMLRTAYATLDEAGDRAGTLAAGYDLAAVLCAQGRYTEARELSARGRDVVGASDVMTRVVALAVDARVAADSGRTDEAETFARDAVALAEQTDALNLRGDAWAALAEVLATTNDSGRETADAWRNAVRSYEAMGNVAAATQARAAAPAAAGA